MKEPNVVVGQTGVDGPCVTRSVVEDRVSEPDIATRKVSTVLTTLVSVKDLIVKIVNVTLKVVVLSAHGLNGVTGVTALLEEFVTSELKLGELREQQQRRRQQQHLTFRSRQCVGELGCHCFGPAEESQQCRGQEPCPQVNPCVHPQPCPDNNCAPQRTSCSAPQYQQAPQQLQPLAPQA